ncbi:triosephosphate isomerase, cytosolic [Senna tora]|uniref:Triosephosphate isomerase, cytosolic n=1 Tax=Senna tora TaxID=362788 RepID=A0A834TK21_9FABA|nr:triosephosphate isomerase, cytosolic [Senna tora]
MIRSVSPLHSHFFRSNINRKAALSLLLPHWNREKSRRWAENSSSEATGNAYVSNSSVLSPSSSLLLLTCPSTTFLSISMNFASSACFTIHLHHNLSYLFRLNDTVQSMNAFLHVSNYQIRSPIVNLGYSCHPWLRKNGTSEEVKKIVTTLNEAKVPGEDVVEVVVSPPYIFLPIVKSSLRSDFHVAAQNCWVRKGGAFTGEVSSITNELV